jgi:hypothetical protein
MCGIAFVDGAAFAPVRRRDLHLIYTWFNLHLIYTWFATFAPDRRRDLHLIYTWFTPDLHLVCHIRSRSPS